MVDRFGLSDVRNRDFSVVHSHVTLYTSRFGTICWISAFFCFELSSSFPTPRGYYYLPSSLLPLPIYRAGFLDASPSSPKPSKASARSTQHGTKRHGVFDETGSFNRCNLLHVDYGIPGVPTGRAGSLGSEHGHSSVQHRQWAGYDHRTNLSTKDSRRLVRHRCQSYRYVETVRSLEIWQYALLGVGMFG
jgi:hypothetical protein